MAREMKDSGISFIGRIPRDWTVLRVKNLGEYRNGLTYSPQDVTDETEGILVLRSSNIKNGKLDLNDNVYVKGQIPSYLMVKEGDILICSRNGSRELIGKNALLPKMNASFGAFMMIYRCSNPSYMYYVLNSPVFTYYLGSFFTSTINQLTGSNYGNMKIPYCPDTDEQQAIVAFLDSKCAEIDALSADIQSEIDTLEAYKRSVITEAVTKGLDKTAPMKDSGIEWVGEIPANWIIHPVYVYFGERKNKNYALQEQNLLSLSYGKIVRKDIDTVGGLLPASFNTYNIVEAGDIIIRPTDLQNDKRSLRTGLATEKGIITSAYIDLAPKGDINSAYFHYLLHSYDVQKVFYNMGNGVRQGLNYSEFSKLMIFAPPRDEQDSIVGYLNEKCAEIESLIAQKKKQLAVLADYKKSVIYEYVTGKKEVV